MSTQNNLKEDKEGGGGIHQRTKSDPFYIFSFLIGMISLLISCLFQDPKLLTSNTIIFDASKIFILLSSYLSCIGEKHSSAHLVYDTGLSEKDK